MRVVYSICFLLASFWVEAQSGYRKDFDFYWNTVRDQFAYFDTQKTNWDSVKKIYGPEADTISSRSSFISFLEKVNRELYNGHISLNTNLPSSGRLVPTGSDLWVEYRDSGFVITSIREGFNADRSGLRIGMIIKRFNGKPLDSAIRPLLPRSVKTYDERMLEFAANQLLAGTHDTKRIIVASMDGKERTYLPDRIPNRTESNHSTLIEQKVLPGNIGYIKINNSLGEYELITAFDGALDQLWNTQGLILDLRETPSGGNTVVARAIMSRFITSELPYQKHSIPSEENQFGVKRSWIELVSPRGRIYAKPLVVLAGRWTGSMGEGIVIGFDAMKRARIAGDKMAGLLGAIYSFTLPETKIGFSVPAEKIFMVDGTPREQFVPEFREADGGRLLIMAIRMMRGRGGMRDER